MIDHMKMQNKIKKRVLWNKQVEQKRGGDGGMLWRELELVTKESGGKGWSRMEVVMTALFHATETR